VKALIPALAALGLLLIYDGISYGLAPHPPSFVRHLDSLLHEAGISRLSGKWLLLLTVFAGLFTGTVVLGLTDSPIVAGTLALGAACLPVAMLHSRLISRRRRFREAWPDALATLIAAVRAGVSLAEACASLTERGPAELRPGFRSFSSTYRASGSFAAGLARLQEELADPVADRVVAALTLTYEAGGTELVRVLRSLGDFIREDLRVRKEIEARWSWTVTAARVAASAPWIVLLMMATRPEAAAAYDSTTGMVVICCGGLATFVGYRLMLRAARLPDETRLTS
jgi:tight adherence protein B